jgi:hypothetical protein
VEDLAGLWQRIPDRRCRPRCLLVKQSGNAGDLPLLQRNLDQPRHLILLGCFPTSHNSVITAAEKLHKKFPRILNASVTDHALGLSTINHYKERSEGRNDFYCKLRKRHPGRPAGVK